MAFERDGGEHIRDGRYTIVRLTCDGCGENQRRVIIDGRAPRCLKCRARLSLAHCEPTPRGVTKCGDWR